MTHLRVKKLSERATLPARATSGSAGYDLFACLDESVIIDVGEIKKIPLGIAIEIGDKDIVALAYARSSLATKHGISPANCVGVIDSDYRGEVCIFLINHGAAPYTVANGDRIAQLVLTPIFTPEIEEVTEITQTQRGAGGFGSTGK